MKIIKHGKQVSCHICSTVMEYGVEDIKIDPLPFHIVCSVCGTFLRIPFLSDSDKAVVEYKIKLAKFYT